MPRRTKKDKQVVLYGQDADPKDLTDQESILSITPPQESSDLELAMSSQLQSTTALLSGQNSLSQYQFQNNCYVNTINNFYFQARDTNVNINKRKSEEELASDKKQKYSFTVEVYGIGMLIDHRLATVTFDQPVDITEFNHRIHDATKHGGPYEAFINTGNVKLINNEALHGWLKDTEHFGDSVYLYLPNRLGVVTRTRLEQEKYLVDARNHYANAWSMKLRGSAAIDN